MMSLRDPVDLWTNVGWGFGETSFNFASDDVAILFAWMCAVLWTLGFQTAKTLVAMSDNRLNFVLEVDCCRS